MAFKETSEHLFQPPKFLSNNFVFDSFNEALSNTSSSVNLDIAAIQSYLSFGYICGNRTLLKEVERQPWLSDIKGNKIELSKVPEHGLYTEQFQVLSDVFFKLLVGEAREVAKEHNDIYILLSGGLDSRIAAGVFKYLYDNGELKEKPKTVSWGLEDSRDVVYAKNIADILDFEWIHVPLQPRNVLENINVTAKELGLLHSPEMLHSMLWFRDLPKDALVIAGSFGDSIGRAEFSNLHLLQLKQPKPVDKFNLLNSEAQKYGQEQVDKDINALQDRSPNAKPYALREHFMQGYRMRGGLCNALSVINGNAKIYQMFTSPKVYKYIWSLHPSVRGNEMYEHLFKTYFPKLAQLPWARTNKALSGKTEGAVNGLRLHYHEYTKWAKNELRSDLENLIDLEWFNQFQIFNINSIKELREIIRSSEVRVGRANDIWLWLAGFRVYVEHLERQNHQLIVKPYTHNESQTSKQKMSLMEKLNNNVLNKNEFINSFSKDVRTKFRKHHTKKLKQEYLSKYPPVTLNKDLFL
jgi:asparagine synthase (glutamine-hydrolysing)